MTPTPTPGRLLSAAVLRHALLGTSDVSPVTAAGLGQRQLNGRRGGHTELKVTTLHKKLSVFWHLCECGKLLLFCYCATAAVFENSTDWKQMSAKVLP